MSAINENELKQHIKSRKFSPVYMIYGAEQMFVSRYTEKLCEAVAGKQPSEFNFHIFEGELNLDTFASSLQVVPFMSEYNCVLVRDIDIDSMAQKPSDIEKLKSTIKSVGEGTVLIISMPTFVAKKQKSAFDSIVRLVAKIGSTCEFAKINQAMIEKYVVKWANQNGKLISHINATKLIGYCGEDLNLLQNETNKICAYSKGEEVTLEDIQKLATINNVEIKVFAMTDAVLNNDIQKAFNSLNTLISQGAEPVPTLGALSNTFIDAYRIRVADECGVLKSTVVSDFSAYKRRAFALDKARTATSRVSTEALRKCLDVLIEADTKMKSDMKDIKNTFQPFMEQLISKLLLIAKEGRV